MPAKKGGTMASLSGLIDSDGDVDMTPSPGSNQENQPSKRGPEPSNTKPRGRPPTKNVSAPKAKPTKVKATSSKRTPLQEQENEQQQSDLENEEDDDLAEDPRPSSHQVVPETGIEPSKKPTARRGRPPGKAKAAAPSKTTAGKVKATQRDGEFEYTPTRPQNDRGAGTQRKEQERRTGRTHDDAQPTDETMRSIEEDDMAEGDEYHKENSARSNTTQAHSNRQTSRKRAGSVSEHDRGSDPALRRKLGEMTRKFESLESRYRNLKEIGIVEAEANFDRLRKQSEQRTKAANDLIESLRNELDTQRKLSQEARAQHSDLHASQKSLAAAEARITDLTSSLNTARKENQALHAKLTAARTAATPNTHFSKVSVSKPGIGSNAEASHALQMSQLKEELYSDLTGLIIRSVDKQDDAAVYDCIQTGCNGSLHFKLSVAPEENASSFEDTEFQYEPRLDRDRDQDLIDIMPDYLSDEISFSRANAAKFYSRIADTITKRLVDG